MNRISTFPFRAAAIFSSFCMVAILLAIDTDPEIGTLLLAALGGTALGCIFAGLISLAISRDSNFSFFLRNQFLRSMGKYSYALYVFHYPINLVVRQTLRGRLSFWPMMIAELTIGLALSYAIARLSWALVESPMLALRDRIGNVKVATAAA